MEGLYPNIIENMFDFLYLDVQHSLYLKFQPIGDHYPKVQYEPMLLVLGDNMLCDFMSAVSFKWFWFIHRFDYNNMHIFILYVFKEYVYFFLQTLTDLKREKELKEYCKFCRNRRACRKGWDNGNQHHSGFFKTEEYRNFILWFCYSFWKNHKSKNNLF